MAAGGEQVGNYSEGLGSKDFSEVVCEPCQEDGKLHKAVGLCINCQDVLCQSCFDGHKIARPFRKHKLLDKQQILQSQVSLNRKDKCTEKCAVHEDDTIKYYCLNHSELGCGACMTLGHKLCDRVIYIPHAANDLANNEEYQLATSQLKYVVERSKELADSYKQKTESLEKTCFEAVEMIQGYRKELNEALDNIEVDLINKCKTLKLEEIRKIEHVNYSSMKALADLHALMAKVETYQNNKQKCKLYTTMMKTNNMLKLAQERIQEAEYGQYSLNNHVRFVTNKFTLNILKHAEVLGKVLGTSDVFIPEETRPDAGQTEHITAAKQEDTSTIVMTKYVKDINIRSTRDKQTCYISGMVDLSNNRAVLADTTGYRAGNGIVKLVDINRGEVITHLTLTSSPWDVAKINNSQVVITLPISMKIAIVSVAALAMTVHSTLNVDGVCIGVDYRDGKLAVSFRTPDKIQVLTLQGVVMHTIKTVKQEPLFHFPTYVKFGQDTSSLFVSNFNNVVHVNFHGTVVGTYTDSELVGPHGLFTDSSGNVYVCGLDSNTIFQIKPDCKKMQVLLTSADGLLRPYAVSYNEKEGMLRVAIYNSNIIRVYKVVLGIKRETQCKKER